MFKRIRNQNGFSAVDTVLSIVIAAIIFGFSTASLSNDVDSYQFVANRKTAMSDARFAVQSMASELMKLKQGDLISIKRKTISFYDESGSRASYKTSLDSSNLSLMRRTQEVMENLGDFNISYFDGDGNEVAPRGTDATAIAQVKRIRLSLTTQATDSEGSITISTDVTPRSFVYEDVH